MMLVGVAFALLLGGAHGAQCTVPTDAENKAMMADYAAKKMTPACGKTVDEDHGSKGVCKAGAQACTMTITVGMTMTCTGTTEDGKKACTTYASLLETTNKELAKPQVQTLCVPTVCTGAKDMAAVNGMMSEMTGKMMCGASVKSITRKLLYNSMETAVGSGVKIDVTGEPSALMTCAAATSFAHTSATWSLLVMSMLPLRVLLW